MLIPPDFRIIAHRGASAYAPENTQPAFELAQKMGVFEAELDTQLSTDGVPVLCHDHTLERYGHGERIVESMTAEELLSLDMGAWFSPYFFTGTPMWSLDQLLERFGDTFIYHIELKGRAETLPDAVYRVVEAHGLLDNAIFTSFSADHLSRMKSVSATARTAWLVEKFDPDILARAKALNLYQLCPKAAHTDKEMVAAGRTVAEEIRAWSLGGRPQEVRRLMRQVVDSGCDGMTLDWPDWAKKIMGIE